jgi:hypothetical protein
MVDGQVHNVVPAPQMTPEQIYKMKREMDGLTVQVGNQAFLAPTEKEAQDFRASHADVMNVADKVQQLVALSGNPAVRVPGTKEHALGEQLVGELKPHLGKQLFARLTELELKSLDSVVPDPTKFLSFSDNTKTKLLSIVDGQYKDLTNKAKSLGFNGLPQPGQDNQVQTKTVGGRSVQIRRF